VGHGERVERAQRVQPPAELGDHPAARFARRLRHASAQNDDFWQYDLFATVAYVRAAANRAGDLMRHACQDLAQCEHHSAP